MEHIKEELAWLLVSASRRGMHATGVAVVTARGTWSVIKEAGAARMFVQGRKFREMVLPRDTTFILGHTRYATHGSTAKAANNHPLFGQEKQPVIVTHNGVLTNYLEVAADLGVQLHAAVDSELLVRLGELSRTPAGIEPHKLAALCADVRGSVALAAVDTNQPTKLVLARDSGSDLVVSSSRRRGIMAWASTEQIAFQALGDDDWYCEDFPASRIATFDCGTPWKAKLVKFNPQRAYREIAHNVAA